ncbi:MAG: ABC transporter substrate-binding protein [Burkholderiales bacterium]|nr:ABC transporter substrate-binding protein [Burkholderiales bacterium]
MMRTKRIWIALVMLLVSPLLLAAEGDPDELIKKTANEVLTIIKQDKEIQAGSHKKIKEVIEVKVLPHFDFTRMTRLAVGRFWNQATPAQQQSLVSEFKTLLVRTYSTSLITYRDQRIDYKPLKLMPADTDVVVKTLIIQPGAQSIPLDYSMIKTPAGWKAYDISVDGVSLVVNYRSSFAQEIQQGGMDQLIKTLQAKNNGLVPDTKKN